MECKICGKEATKSDYCVFHEKAYRNLMAKFETWEKALDLSWRDYLNQIVENPSAGTKAKEVAEALLSEG